MDRQCAGAVLMVRPAHFFIDPDTAASNLLQPIDQIGRSGLLENARADFDRLAEALCRTGLTVCVVDAPSKPVLPDAVFPNNWFSTHEDGTFVLYPLLAPNRRLERTTRVAHALQQQFGFRITRTIDLSSLEQNEAFVEGTGSLVVDRVHRSAFAALSPRTTARGVHEACERLGLCPIMFTARHADGSPIYHTNVMLSIGHELAIGCFESITDETERRAVMGKLGETGRGIVSLTQSQMHDFAANCLEVDAAGEPVLVFSARAWSSLNNEQKQRLEAAAGICIAEISTIERFGGGGVRCMLAEIFLPRADDGDA